MIQDEQQLVAMLGGSTPQVMMSQMILSEFRTFRDVEWRDFYQQVTQWRSDMSEHVAKIEVVVEAGLTGNNSTPSRLTVLEVKMQAFDKLRWQLFGVVSAVSALIGWFFPRNGIIEH
jgi:hypothetical protein